MIIKMILLLGLLLAIAYAFLQRRKSALISGALAAIAGLGIFFVILPEKSTMIANFIGVGRGADLVLYCWLIISLLVSVNLQFKVLDLQANIVQLTRALALRFPAFPDEHPDSM